MNKDEILNMSAGREMDMLVGEKVMGWIYNQLGDAWIREGQPWVGCDAFHPSTDISAAWDVVEKLHSDFSIDLSYDDPQTIEPIKWCCELYAKSEPYQDYEARADSAPLAICRAALLATLNL